MKRIFFCRLSIPVFVQPAATHLLLVLLNVNKRFEILFPTSIIRGSGGATSLEDEKDAVDIVMLFFYDSE